MAASMSDVRPVMAPSSREAPLPFPLPGAAPAPAPSTRSASPLPLPNQKASRNGTRARDPVAISSRSFSMRAVKE